MWSIYARPDSVAPAATTPSRNALAYHVIRAAGLDCQFEVPPLVSDTKIRPACILVHPSVAPNGEVIRPTACDLTVFSPFKATATATVIRAARGAADFAYRVKITDLERKLTRRLPPPSNSPAWDPAFDFKPIAVDSLGSLAVATVLLLKGSVPHRARRYHIWDEKNCLRIYQRLSSVLWLSIAMDILFRASLNVAMLKSPAMS